MKRSAYKLNTLILAPLTGEQIAIAKSTLGARRQITHVLVCGSFGKMFGTEKQCRKYFAPWSTDFPTLFDQVIEANGVELTDYEETDGLVMRLIDAQGKRKPKDFDLSPVEMVPLSPTTSSHDTGLLDMLKRLFGIGDR